MITKAPSSNLPSALVAKLLPFVDSIKDRKWSDDDVKDDVEFLREELKKKFDGLTLVSFLTPFLWLDES